MIIEKTMNLQYLSNTYLVADKPGGHAVLIDTGGPTGPILERIEELRVTPTHVLCTHHHIDHVGHNGEYKARFGCPICGHGTEREMFGGLDVELGDGDDGDNRTIPSSRDNTSRKDNPSLRLVTVSPGAAPTCVLDS